MRKTKLCGEAMTRGEDGVKDEGRQELKARAARWWRHAVARVLLEQPPLEAEALEALLDALATELGDTIALRGDPSEAGRRAERAMRARAVARVCEIIGRTYSTKVDTPGPFDDGGDGGGQREIGWITAMMGLYCRAMIGEGEPWEGLPAFSELRRTRHLCAGAEARTRRFARKLIETGAQALAAGPAQVH